MDPDGKSARAPARDRVTGWQGCRVANATDQVFSRFVIKQVVNKFEDIEPIYLHVGCSKPHP